LVVPASRSSTTTSGCLLHLQLLRAVPAPDGVRRCDFYLPKQSSQAQLLEATDGLQRMLVEPLNDDERTAVEGDEQAVGRLIDLLADVATPVRADIE
jgi:hypothetical protein